MDSSKYPLLSPNDDSSSIEFHYSDVKHIEKIKISPNLKELLHSLTHQCSSVINKVGAIFYWLGSNNEKEIIFNKPLGNSVEYTFNILFTEVAVKPKLFEFMCRHIDVPCYTIRGIARDITYQRLPSKGTQSNNHTWNCVFVNGKWYLCDISWSTSAITKTDQDWSLEKARKSVAKNVISPHYFLSAPLKFRNSHFPTTGKEFQLLSHIITFDQFDNHPIFSECFFDSILSTFQPESLPLISDDGFYKVSIPCKKEASFVHLLEYFDEKQRKLIWKSETNVHLKDYVLLEVTKENIVLYFRFPWIGIYYLTLFIQDNSESDLSCIFKGLMKLKIKCCAQNPKISAFYGCHDISYGPSWPHLRYYELSPVNLTKGIVKIDYSPPAYIEACFNKLNADVNVVAKIRGSKTLLPQNYHPAISENIVSCSCNGECLDFLIDEEDDSDSEVTITIRIPTYGEYALEIYANIPMEGDKFVQVAQYMIDLKKDKLDLIDGPL